MSWISLLLLLLPQLALAAGEVPYGFVLDGVLYDSPGGTTTLLDTGTIRVQILNPAKTCVLYDEQQSFNTTSSNGAFNLSIGTAVGSGRRVAGSDSGNSMTTVFQNRTASITGAGACTYNPAAGDGRYVRVFVTPTSTGVTDQLSPEMLVGSVPTAIVAESLQGIDKTGFLQLGAQDLTQANVETVFTTANYATLTSLLSGGGSTGGSNTGAYTINSGTGGSGGINFNTNGTTRASIAYNGDFTVGSNALFVNGTTGKVGLGTNSTTYDFSLGGAISRAIGMERNSTANTAGNALTVSSGGATSGATDKAGGDLYLASGAATGTGSSNIYLQTATAGVTGTTDRSPTTKMTILGDGSVGIGIATPTAGAILDITGTGAAGSSMMIPRDTTANRPTTGVNGMLRYNSSVNQVEGYINSRWATLIDGRSSAATGSLIAGPADTPSGSGVAGGTNAGARTTVYGAGAFSSANSNTDNTAIGYLALASNTGGWTNTAVGSSALASNTTGSSNVAIGTSAGSNMGPNASFSGNVIVGDYDSTGMAIIAGADNNTIIGRSAAANLTTGAHNIVIGQGIDVPSATGSNQLNIGNLIFGTGMSGTGSTIAGSVGIGTSSPNTKLHVSGSGDVVSTVQTSSGTGSSAALRLIGGASNADWHVVTNRADLNGSADNLGFYKTSGTSGTKMVIRDDGNVGIGTTNPSDMLTVEKSGSVFATVRNTGASGAAGFQAYSNNGSRAYNTFYAGAAAAGAKTKFIMSEAGNLVFAKANDAWSTETYQMVIQNNGNVGIGTTGPSYKLDVVGDIAASGCLRSSAGVASGTCVSDERLKTDVQPFDLGLEALLGINPHFFRYNGLAGHPASDKPELGVIAQEVEKTAPQLIVTKEVKLNPEDNQTTEIKQVNYTAFTYVLINSVKDLYRRWFNDSQAIHRELASKDQEITKLKVNDQAKDQQIQKLEHENAEMKARLDKIEKMLNSK